MVHSNRPVVRTPLKRRARQGSSSGKISGEYSQLLSSALNISLDVWCGHSGHVVVLCWLLGGLQSGRQVIV